MGVEREREREIYTVSLLAPRRVEDHQVDLQWSTPKIETKSYNHRNPKRKGGEKQNRSNLFSKES